MPGGALGWLRRRDPDLRVVTKAAQVALAATVGMYVGLYVLDDATFAIYALFGAASVGALSQVVGSPPQRTRIFLGMLLAGYVLVTAGTFAAVTLWTASLGMLVVGFVVAYAGVGGPALVGAANGVQLFYILPCFPPYAPGTLGSRLLGLTVGILLVALLDRVLRPNPGPAPYEPRLRAAASVLSGYASAVAGALRGDAPASPTDMADRRAAAEEAVARTRPSWLPIPERPASPTRRDHALKYSAGHLRAVLLRLHRLEVRARAQQHRHVDAAAVLDATALALADVARSTPTSPPADVALQRSLLDFSQTRLERLRAAASSESMLRERIRTDGTAVEAATFAALLVGATRISAGLRPETDLLADDPSGPFWYAHVAPHRLWVNRLVLHLTTRSVYFRNALRIAGALVLARVLVDVLDLTHGFWVLLATLSLMRTSAADTRTTLRPAFIGTVTGALVAGVVLTVVGDTVVVYEVVLPVVLFVAFSAGPLIGVAWGQGMFTLVVCFAFVQVAPSDYKLAEARLADVVVGGLAGALIGLLAWPRGGGGQLADAVATALRTAGRFVRETAETVVAAAPAAISGRAAQHEMVFASSTYDQQQAERANPSAADWDWLGLLSTTQAMVGGSERMRAEFGVEHGVPWPPARAMVERSATMAEDRAGLLASVLEAERPSAAVAPGGGQVDEPAMDLGWLAEQLRAGSVDLDLLRVVDVQAWLTDVVHDLEQAEPMRAREPVLSG